MKHTIRSIATKVVQKAAARASLVQYSTFGVPSDDGDCTPLRGPPAKSGRRNNDGDSEAWEQQIRNLRSEQDRLYLEESLQRERDLATIGLVHAADTLNQCPRSDPNPIAHEDTYYRVAGVRSSDNGTPRSHHSSIQKGLDYTPPMWAQQSGNIRSQQLVEQDEEIRVTTYRSSNASSVKRRGAVKHKLNPLFARPSQDDFGWSQSRKW
jgi:hypothetical protein